MSGISDLGGSDFGGGPRAMRRRGLARGPWARRETVLALAIAAISASLFFLVSIYGNGLRDPRYLDGWLLAGGMALQLMFHIVLKTARLQPRSAARWKQLHIFTGYLLIAAFVSHADFTLPDTGFEWAISVAFTLVTLSGLFGTYLAWSMTAGRERGMDRSMGGGDDGAATRRAELAMAVQAVVSKSEAGPADAVLPAPPFQAWIKELYGTHLKDYFEGRAPIFSHLFGSDRAMRRLMDEIEALSRFVDRQNQDRLDAIKALVAEKHRLDSNSIQAGLMRGWLYVHVPATYALIVLSVLHILIVYAFSSGVW